MMNNWAHNILIYLLFVLTSHVLGVEKTYWDLGVIIEQDYYEPIQKEIDLDQINNNLNIKAFHSDNFVTPKIQMIATTLMDNNNILKKYDDFIINLSLPEKISIIKQSFLNKEFNKFFSIYNFVKDSNTQETPIINSMHIQNLYYSNQFEKAMNEINNISNNNMSPEILFYKIKILIKLKKLNKVHIAIHQFTTNFNDDDLMPYVLYEQKLITHKHND